jgi:hypothetical protein
VAVVQVGSVVRGLEVVREGRLPAGARLLAQRRQFLAPLGDERVVVRGGRRGARVGHG